MDEKKPKATKLATYLDWSDFQFKLDKENRLSGPDNWEMWISVLSVALMSIGYEEKNQKQLTVIDEAKLARVA